VSTPGTLGLVAGRGLLPRLLVLPNYHQGPLTSQTD